MSVDVGTPRAGARGDQVEAGIEDIDRKQAVGASCSRTAGRPQLGVGVQDRHEHAKRSERRAEPVARRGRGHVASGGAAGSTAGGSLGLGLRQRERRGRSIDPDDVERRVSERNRHPSGAAAELEDRAADLVGERSEERDVVAAGDVGGVLAS